MKSREMLKLEGYFDSYTVKGYYKSVTKSICSISESRERGRLSLESTLSRFLCLTIRDSHALFYKSTAERFFISSRHLSSIAGTR